jgi:hypothetical protein
MIQPFASIILVATLCWSEKVTVMGTNITCAWDTVQ